MGIESALPIDSVLTTQLNRVINWARRSSVWPMPFATACCGIELMATACSRFDLARFGAEVMRFSPRQSDLLIVAGRVSVKTLPVLQNQVDALLEFDCSPNELTNGVMNTAFMFLFRDLIRLFACYNDGIINLLGMWARGRKAAQEGRV